MLAALALTTITAAGIADDELHPGVDGIASIEALANALRSMQPGRLIKLELDEEHGRAVYEVRLLTEDGRVVKMSLDARTLTLLERRIGRHEDDDREDD